ncbi:MAG: alpha-E domain-containing protein [Pseudomonadota bacterium]
MLSRTADHLYWMARYMERAGQARSACGEAKMPRRAKARAGFSATVGANDAF